MGIHLGNFASFVSSNLASVGAKDEGYTKTAKVILASIAAAVTVPFAALADLAYRLGATLGTGLGALGRKVVTLVSNDSKTLENYTWDKTKAQAKKNLAHADVITSSPFIALFSGAQAQYKHLKDIGLAKSKISAEDKKAAEKAAEEKKAAEDKKAAEKTAEEKKATEKPSESKKAA